MSKKLRISALMAVVMVILALVICLAACNPTSEVTHKVKTTFESSQGDVVLTPEAQDGIYKDGTEVTVTVSAKSGYEFDSLTVSTDPDAALDGEGKYTFKVTADTTITVLFRSTTPTPTDCEHTNLSALVPYKAPTCTEQGVVAHYHCNDCNKDLSEDKSEVLTTTTIGVDPTAHSFGTWEAEVPATCTDEGTAAHKDCTLCHKHFDADGVEIPAGEYTLAVDGTAHRFGALQSQQDATCGVDGVKAHKDCELCHKHFTEEGVEIPDNELSIPATNAHTFDKYENCGDEGHKVVCSVCDKPQTGDVTQHTYSGYVADGQTGHHQECVCGYHTSVESHTVGSEPAYSNDNEYTHTYTCDKCNVRVTEEHSMDDWKVDGEGKHYHGCVCGRETEHGEHTFGESPVYTDAGDGTHHTAVCTVCHLTVQLDHSTKLVPNDDASSGHHTECTLCDYKTEGTTHSLQKEQIQAKELDGVVSENPGGQTVYAHRDVCECGYKTELVKCTLEYKYEDESGHWQECSECHLSPRNKQPIAHEWVNRTNETHHWTQCVRCNFEKPGTKGEHNIDENVWKDCGTQAPRHYNPCSGCSYVGHNQEDHVYSLGKYQPTPDDEQSTHQLMCDKCGYLNKTKEQHVWDEETHTTDDNDWDYHICTKCQGESAKTLSKSHVHRLGEDTKWYVAEDGRHYQKCVIEGHPFNYHDAKYTLNDGWYDKDGHCEEDGCTISAYTVTNGALTGYTGKFTKIKLPEQLVDNATGQKVSINAIGLPGASTSAKGVFYSATLTHMVLPECVTTINKYAFYGAALEEINFSHVTTIDGYAFQNTKLKEVDLSSVTAVNGNGVFSGVDTLVKAKVNVCATAMFANCTSLTTVIFTENFKSMDKNMFTKCAALKTVVFESTSMIDCTASKFSAVQAANLTVYYKFAKEEYDATRIKDTVLKAAHIKFYYESNPWTDGGGTTVEDGEAWHFNQEAGSDHYYDLGEDGNLTNIQLWTKENA